MADENDDLPRHPLEAPSLTPIAELVLSHPIEDCTSDATKARQARAEIKLWMRDRATEVERYLQNFNTFDVLANITFSQLAYDPETYKEATHEGLSAVAEYACLLMARHPFTEGNGYIIDGRVIEQVTERIRDILRMRTYYDVLESVPSVPGQERSALAFFQFHTRGYEISVRAPGYLHHLRERLHALFDPFASELLVCVGFAIDDVLHVEDACEAFLSERLTSRKRKAREAKQQLLQEIKAAKSGQVDAVNPEFREAAAWIAEQDETDIEQHVETLMTVWLFSFLGEGVFTFKAADLAALAPCPVERIQAVLDFFEVRLGSIVEDTSIPSPTHILRSRPFLRHEDIYFYSVPSTMLWAVRNRLEEALNPNTRFGKSSTPGLWDRYEKARSIHLESEAVRLVSAALGSATAFQNVKYWINPGDQQPAELDGLIFFDQTLLLIEAKAGSLTATAKRGSGSRLENNLKDLLGEPHSQATRAKDYIASTDRPCFTTVGGDVIEIDKHQIARVLMLTVTLEPLDHYSSLMHELSRAGIIGDGEMPWSVSIDSLRIISEVIEFPSQLIHYIIRRLGINKHSNLRFMEELDIFGCYLDNGLYFENESEIQEASIVQFASFTTAFDDYYFYEMGLRETPAPKPMQVLPELIRKLILEVEGRSEARGFSEVVIQLLNWDGKARNQLATHLQKVREMTLADGKNHNFSIVSTEGRSGVTCVSTTSTKQEWGLAELVTLVRRKTQEFRYPQWLGLLTCVDEDGLLHGFFIDGIDDD